jgi:polyisoprenoid-binding protein YceI
MTTSSDPPLLLHVGCGDQRLEGWVNIDRQDLPAVDLVADVTIGLPFEGAAAVFAEHFLEHLPLDQALAFLLECQRVLAPGGRLRLSTPNLDWTLAAEYVHGQAFSGPAAAALRLNRGFYGWSHRFLWNGPLLAAALDAAGFTDLCWCRHGESEWPPFRGLERHARDRDLPELPHVLIVEARKGERDAARLAAFRDLARREFLHQARPLGWRIDAAHSSLIARLDAGGPLHRLVRQHVFRVAWIGGALFVYPEAPEESHVVVDFDLRHLLVDEPTMRAIGQLPSLPATLWERVKAFARGSDYLDTARWPLIRFRAASFTPRDGEVSLQGELELRGAIVALPVRALVTREGDNWRARGSLSLVPAEIGLPRWWLARGLLRGGGRLLVDFDLVATPVAPT